MDTKLHVKITRSIQQTVMLSPSATRLLQVTADPDHDLQDVIKIIRHDFALTARILRVVNSVIFGLLQPVGSIDQAVVYLGEGHIIALAIVDCAGSVFNSPLTGYEGQRGDLWRHQLYSAIASRIISRYARKVIRADLAFTGGLLHDIGKAVLSEHITNSSSEILAGITEEQFSDYPDAEKKLFGINHMRAGHMLAQHWKLPVDLQDIILYHHHPAEAPAEHQALAYAVHLGDALSMLAGVDTGSDGLKYHIDDNYHEFFDLSGEKLELLQVEAGAEYQKFKSSIDI